ncbi:hypothetical protein GOC31_13800 [Sinorhizobium meliloti]|nr:hypothetical protein [Sinorhizobium meliloti]
MAVTRDQFDIVDDVTVRHRPTGVTLSTYRYKNPGEAGDFWVRNAGPEEDNLNLYEMADIRRVAMEILKDQQANPR